MFTKVNNKTWENNKYRLWKNKEQKTKQTEEKTVLGGKQDTKKTMGKSVPGKASP